MSLTLIHFVLLEESFSFLFPEEFIAFTSMQKGVKNVASESMAVF
jgi:hypothetical protein